jgi:hypothetical protein
MSDKDPKERKKENELDPNTQLEKQTFATLSSAAAQLHQSGHSWIVQHFVDLIVGQRTTPPLEVPTFGSTFSL